jgi:acylphosphatase
MIRFTVHFAGRVQGVGFRYTAVNVSRSHCAAGYVQNLSDGRVVLVVEGEQAALTALVDDLKETMRDYIRDCTIVRSPATGEFGTAKPGAVLIRR